MTFCPYCGTELSPSDMECPDCHAPIGMKAPEEPVCRECGKALSKGMSFCPYCGARVDPVNIGNTEPENKNTVSQEKSTFIALILSLFVTGLGSIYAGKEQDGVVLLIAMIVCFILGFIFVLPWLVCVGIWLYGLYHAYKSCEEFNSNLH